MACESVKHNYTSMQTKGSSDGSWVNCLMGHCDPLSTLHKVANETSLNQMTDSDDDEQYAKFANSVRQ